MRTAFRLAALAALSTVALHAQTPAPMTDQPTVLIAVTSHSALGDTGRTTGYYLSEVSHPWHALVAAGYAVAFVSPQGGEAPLDPGSRKTDDPINAAFLASADFEALSHTLRPEDVDPADYVAVWYAGGHGTMWDFAENERLAQIAAKIYDAGGVVGAVCHGPAGLVNVRLSDGSYLVAGKRVAAFTDDEERAAGLDAVVPFLLQSTLEARGADHRGAALWQSHVEVDGRLVTGQNPASAQEAGEALVRVLDEQVVPARTAAVAN